MKQAMRRIMAVLLTAVILAVLLPAVTLAEGTIQNIHITFEGILSWDPYPGAVRYWVGVDGSFLPNANNLSYNLKERIDEALMNHEYGFINSGTHEIVINACDENSEIIATGKVVYNYTSSVVAPLPEITNIKVNEGKLSWDAYTGTESYTVYVSVKDEDFNTSMEPVAETTVDIDDFLKLHAEGKLIPKKGKCQLRIDACDTAGFVIARGETEYEYEVKTSAIVVGDLQNVVISADGMLTWKAYNGTNMYWVGVDGNFSPSYETSFNLKQQVKELVKAGTIENNGTHQIEINARNAADAVIGQWEGIYNYKVPEEELNEEGPGTGDNPITGETQEQNEVTVSGAVYLVNPAQKTAMFVRSEDTNIKKLTIPATISVNKTIESYKVTAIADNACKGLKKLTEAVIGKNVKTIGKNAFASCKKLTKVTISKAVTTIGAKAFYKCGKLKSIVISTRKLTKNGIGKNCFKGIASKAAFKCPKNKLADYTAWLKKPGGAPKGAKFSK